MLLLVAQAAGEHGRAEHQQDVSHDRPDDRGLDHIMETGAQGGERDDQLGSVAECRVEETADSLARAVGQLFCGSAEPGG